MQKRVIIVRAPMEWDEKSKQLFNEKISSELKNYTCIICFEYDLTSISFEPLGANNFINWFFSIVYNKLKWTN